jgi:hypothetical protein
LNPENLMQVARPPEVEQKDDAALARNSRIDKHYK